MRIAIRPIRYTAHLAQMHGWARALGMVTLLETNGWITLAAGRGRLALHAVPDGDPLAGTTTLALETDDLDALEARWQDAGLEVRRIDDHGIPLLFVASPFGGEIAAGEWSADPVQRPASDLAVMPMLVSRDVGAAADWLADAARLGLRRRISSEGGGWVDLELPDDGGLVAVHHAGNLSSEEPAQPPSVPGGTMPEVGVGLTFEHPDVDALCEQLQAAGLADAHVVDEAYNRTLLVECPDGEQIWVNGVMTDLYGYRRD